MPNQRVNLEVGVGADTRRYEAGMNRVQRATRGTNTQLERTQRRMRDVTTQTRRTEAAFNRFATRLAGLAFGFLAIDRAGRALVGTLNTIQQLENRLRLVTDTEREFVDIQQDLLQISRQTGSSLRANTEEFTRLAVSVERTLIPLGDMVRIQRILAQNEAVTGITGPSVRAARIQLIQGLAADRFSGQELRSVLEQDPATAQLIAAGLGIPVGQLRVLAEGGGTGTRAVSGAILSQEQAVAERFGAAEITISRAFNTLSTEMFNLVERFDELTGIGDDLANVLVDFANLIRSINLSFPARLYQRTGEFFQYLDRSREAIGLGGQAAVGAGIAGVSLTRDLSLLRREEQLLQQLRFGQEQGFSREELSRRQLQLSDLRNTDSFRRADRLRDNLSRARAFAGRAGVAGAAVGGLLELGSFIDRQGFGQFRRGRDVSDLSDDALEDLIQTLRLDRETFRDLISAAETERDAAAQRVQLPGIAGGGELDISAFDPTLLTELQDTFQRIEDDLLTALADQFRRADEAEGRITRRRGGGTEGLVDDAERLRLNRQLFEVLDTIAQQQASVSSPQINRAAGIIANRALAEARRVEGQAGLSGAFGRLAIFNRPVNEPLIQSIDELTIRLEELGGTFREVTPEMEEHTRAVEQLGQSIAETLVQGIRDGASAMQIFGDIASQILDRIIQQAITNPVGDAIGDFLLSSFLGGVQGLGPNPAPGGSVGNQFSNIGSGYSTRATATTAASTRGLSISVNGVQDPTIVRNEIERMYPEIARVATGATVQASRRPGPVRRFVG